MKTPGNYIRDAVTAASSNTSPNNNIMVAGKRGIIGAVPNSTDLVPLFGFPKISLYTPFELPGFGDGNSCLAYLKGCGFAVGFGQTTTTALPAPTTAVVATDGVTWTLTFTGIPMDFQPMLNIAISGSVTQGASIGAIQSATVNASGNGQLIVVVASSSVIFTTSAVLDVTYTNLNIATPDPTATEQVCMQLYTIFQEMPTVRKQIAKPVTDAPTVRLTLYATTDTSYSESTASIALTTPAAISVVTATGAVLLGWTGTTQPSGWGYLPDQAVGNIVVTHTPVTGDPATGTLFQKGVGDPVGLGWTYYMILTDVVGTFAATTAFTVVKDGTQDLASMTEGIASKYYLGYHDMSAANAALTTQFKSIIDIKNSYYIVSQNDGVGAFGFLANTSTVKTLANTLPELNDRYMVTTFFPVPSNPLLATPLNDIYSSSASAFVMVCAALNGAPFNPLNNIISSTLQAPTSKLYQLKKGALSDSETVLKRGYTPLYVTKFGQVATVRVVTSMLTLEGTELPDGEFFPITTQQILMSFNEAMLTYYALPQFQNQRKTDTVKGAVWAGAYNMAINYQNNGMFANVAASKDLFQVRENPDQVDSWFVDIPAQVVPELNNLFVNVNVYSFLIQF